MTFLLMFTKKRSSHINSAEALARALYSSSLLDLDTVACFLALHETKFGPNNIAKSHVDHHQDNLSILHQTTFEEEPRKEEGHIREFSDCIRS
jgi:hypothetical protein